MKKIILLGLLLLSAHAQAKIESYGSCQFDFQGNTHHFFEISTILLEAKGAESPKNSIMNSLCNAHAKGTIYIRPSTNDKKDPIGKKNGLYHLKMNMNSCDFNFYYGSKGNKFMTKNDYNTTCLPKLRAERSSRSSNRKPMFRLTAGKGAFSNDTYVYCEINRNNSGLVQVNPGYNSTICAVINRGGKSSKCKPANRWSIQEAATYICE